MAGLVPGEATAHEVRPAFLSIAETEPGEFEVLWKRPVSGEFAVRLMPHLSDGSLERAPDRVDQAPGFLIAQWLTLKGNLAGQMLHIEGLDRTITQTVVIINWIDGRLQQAILSPSQPSLTLSRAGGGLNTYLALGIEHILTGPDHLMFLFGLMLLIANRTRLLMAITAFTVAHSTTLAAAVLGFVAVPVMLVESLVALSVACLAAEVIHARRGRDGISTRRPWLMAFAFGLLHGLAFAGGLAEIGVPIDRVPLSLLSFNVGVEAGQLAFIGAVLALKPTVGCLPVPVVARLAPVASYVIGIAGGYWSMERIAVDWSLHIL